MIEKWYTTVDRASSFMNECLKVVKIKWKKIKQKNTKFNCSLVLDEMCIR